MLPSRFASLGNTISTISEVDALTGFPGGDPDEIAVTVPPGALGGTFLRPLLLFVVLDIRSVRSALPAKFQIKMSALGLRPQARYNTRFNAMTQTQKPRREVLEQFVAEKPTDAFARYGLALECMKLGDNDAATTHFQRLLEANPKYVAGYFQFGQHLSRIGQLEQARKLLSDGILVAQNAGDMHARDEMQAALALLR
jgi:tetratricopeptide (TPR) repeat protein